MLAVSAWYMRKERHVEAFHRTGKIALIVLIPTIIIQLSVGNQLGVIETHYQPMKIAAAEAQWNSCKPCSFSALQFGGFTSAHESATVILPIPHLLSVLATGTWNGAVTGLNQLQASYRAKYGPGNYIPNVAIQYWSMRVMAYLGTLILLFALWGAWLLYRQKLRTARVFLLAGTWLVITPFLINTAGWLLTESGRQPWIVQGLQKTAVANSPSVSATDIWISLTVFVLAYILLGIADATLMLRYSRKGMAQADREAAEQTNVSDTATPVLTY
jgi:cytochrome d ubiquinol oxidase subunit I